MVQYKKPVNSGTNATDSSYMFCKVQDVDPVRQVATVTDQLGIFRQITTTRSLGKPLALPAVGETWIISNLFGEWVFSVAVNVSVYTPPAQLSGTITITPTTINTPKSATVTFPSGLFTSPPRVLVTPQTAFPSGVTAMTGVGTVTTTSAVIWLLKGDTVATGVNWFATV
jgi:hypothetical protein